MFVCTYDLYSIFGLFTHFPVLNLSIDYSGSQPFNYCYCSTVTFLAVTQQPITILTLKEPLSSN